MRQSLRIAFLLTVFISTTALTVALLTNPGPRPHLCVALVPVLMLGDYYTTLAYASLVRQANRDTDLARIELNPMWKSDVARLRNGRAMSSSSEASVHL